MPLSRRGTGFVNLQTYLGLNQGGAQALGEGLGQQLGQQSRDARAAIDAAGMEAQNRVLAGIPDPGGAYGGPNSFGEAADVGMLTNQAAAADKAVAAAQTQSGRAELLAQKYGPGTWGGSQLDSALAGAGGGAQALAGGPGGAQRLSAYLSSTAQGVNNFISSARGQTNAQQAQGSGPRAPVTSTRPQPGAPYNQRKRDDLDKYGGRP